MTTFKNNAKYAELLFTYLDVAFREDTPLTVEEVLSVFSWRLKGGSLSEAANGTRLCPETSGDYYPDCDTRELAKRWPLGRDSGALARILKGRAAALRLRSRAVLARLSTYQLLTSCFGEEKYDVTVYSGMKSVYHLFDLLWEWAGKGVSQEVWDLVEAYTEELVAACCGVASLHLPTVGAAVKSYKSVLRRTQVPGLLHVVFQLKALIGSLNGARARKQARVAGREELVSWKVEMIPGMMEGVKLRDRGLDTPSFRMPVGPLSLVVSHGMCFLGLGRVRYAMSMSDVERLHQLVMSAASALVGVCSQAVVGTTGQSQRALRAVRVTSANIGRIVQSSRRVPVGSEVLVCKGYRRAYTAFLGVLAGRLCTQETEELVLEAEGTASPGVIDVRGLIADCRTLDAASALNAAKMFKICPAPDVSPGGAMIDRIKTIGDGNVMNPEMRPLFEEELRSQILRAFIRHFRGRLSPRSGVPLAPWHSDYMKGDFDKVPSADIHTHLDWEGAGEMPEISAYDPGHWKDSGLGADTLKKGMANANQGVKNNMITRLLFDSECPMPGSMNLNDEHVIKFFTKAEGHKDPARGIFSANLMDRHAQSWMERGVDAVAREHPSFMIGQSAEVKEAKAMALTARPEQDGYVALYYSFDISGWSAKMPGEPQRISHRIWADLYGGHLYSREHLLNEGATIYMNLDGYKGWFKNTHANLEGFNGKEMTMVLVALLALSVRRWRSLVCEEGVMEPADAEGVSALLFAYIDDGLSRIDLPRDIAERAFEVYKNTVIDTFNSCGFSVEVSKCFPSDRFAIFLNEVYLGGRHVVHGVRAAMGISAEPTERHTSLVERTSSVCTGVRGAVIAGLDPVSAVMLMAYHLSMHLKEWVKERDPVVLASWSVTPRAWGGLGVPNAMQLYVSGSGSAFEESVATLQTYARINPCARKAFLKLARGSISTRSPTGILTAPLSGRVEHGYMMDSRVSVAVRSSLQIHVEDERVSPYAARLLKYADSRAFALYADAIVPRSPDEVLQEQILIDLAESHPHSVFSAFARRLEKSSTVRMIVGWRLFTEMIRQNRMEAEFSIQKFRNLTY